MAWFHWLILLLCGSMLTGNFRALQTAWFSADWPVRDPKVVWNGSAGDSTRRSDRRSSVTLEYQVEGRTYQYTESGHTLTGDDGAALPSGANASVRVNPADPNQATVVSGLQRIGPAWWWSLAFALGVPVLLVWNAWYRPRVD